MKIKSQHTKAHTFASSTSQRTDQSLQKSVLYADPRRNSNFFSPTLRCFNFLATAQPTTDKQSDSLLQTLTGQCNLTWTTEARTGNTRLAQWGLTSLIGSLCFYCKFVLVDSLVFHNPPLRQAWERYAKPVRSEQTVLLIQTDCT